MNIGGNMNDCIERTCAFTGHRPEKLEYKESHVITWLEDMIWQAVNDGYTAFMSGMQRGVDIWAAEAVLRIKSKGENIRLVAVSAFKDMENNWSDDWKEKYKDKISNNPHYYITFLNFQIGKTRFQDVSDFFDVSNGKVYSSYSSEKLNLLKEIKQCVKKSAIFLITMILIK